MVNAKVGVPLGIAGITVSAALMLCLNIVASGQMSALSTTMSDYVFVDGVGWMFAAAVVSVAVAGLGAILGLAGTGLMTGGWLRAALGLAVFGALVAAVFPTDLGESLSVSAQIHRYAVGVVFFCVPLAGALIVRRLDGVPHVAGHRAWLYRTAVLTAVVLAVYLASHFGVLAEPMEELRGLFQRLLFLLELATLAQVIRLARQVRGLAEQNPAGRRSIWA